MKESELRSKVLKILRLTDAPKEEQDLILARIDSIANQRFALALPELLTDEQLREVDKMNTDGRSDKEINDWIESQLEDYQGSLITVIQSNMQCPALIMLPLLDIQLVRATL